MTLTHRLLAVIIFVAYLHHILSVDILECDSAGLQRVMIHCGGGEQAQLMVALLTGLYESSILANSME